MRLVTEAEKSYHRNVAAEMDREQARLDALVLQYSRPAKAYSLLRELAWEPFKAVGIIASSVAAIVLTLDWMLR